MSNTVSIDNSQPKPKIKFNVRFTNYAASQFLKLIASIEPASSALSSIYLEDEDEKERIRDEARNAFESLIQTDQSYDCYLRKGRRNVQDDDKFELFFATDSAGESNRTLAERINDRTFVITGLEKSDNYSRYDRVLLVTSVNALSNAAGYSTQFDLPIEAVFVSSSKVRSSSCGLPWDVAQKMRRLPNYQDEKITVEKRLNDWKAYLNLVERMANEKKYRVEYARYRWGANKRTITLTLKSGLTDEVQSKIRKSFGEWIFVKEAPLKASKTVWKGFDDDNAPQDADDDDDWFNLGTVREFWPDSGELRVEIDDDLAERIDNGHFKMPSSGLLEYRADGELVQINRLKFGLDSLSYGRARNFRLSEFLFDPTKAGLPQKQVSLDENDLLLKSLAGNKEQKAAVEGVLSAPDLYLIQGPPGTGKTTVIAEICYQIARRGGRTLVASQANLAVDNALSRLVHHPSIRALRRGKADRVEIEGAPYLEDRVVSTWLESTAKACQSDLATRQARIRMLESVLMHRADIERMAKLAIAFNNKNTKLLSKIRDVESEIASTSNEIQRGSDSLAEISFEISALHTLRTAVTEYKSKDRAPMTAGELDPQLSPLLQRELAPPSLVESTRKLTILLSQWYPGGFARINEYVHLRRNSAACYFTALQSLDVVGELKSKHTEMQPVLDQLDTLCASLIGLLKEERRRKAALADKLQQVQDLNPILARADKEHLDHNRKLGELHDFSETVKHSWFEIECWIKEAQGALPRIDDLPDQLRPDVSRLVWPVAIEPVRRNQRPQASVQPQTLRAQIEGLKRLNEALSDFTVDVWPYVQNGKPVDRSQDRWRKSELSLFLRQTPAGTMCAAPNALNMLKRLHGAYKTQKSGLINKLLSKLSPSQNDNQLFADLQMISDAIETEINLLEKECRVAEQSLSLSNPDNLTGQVMEAALHETMALIGKAELKAKEVERFRLDLAAQHAKLSTVLDEINARLVQADREITSHLQDIDRFRQQLQVDPWVATVLPTLPGVNPTEEQRNAFVSAWPTNWLIARSSLDKRLNEILAASAKVNPLEALNERIGVLARKQKFESDQVERLKHVQIEKESELVGLKSKFAEFEDVHRNECEWWSAVHERVPAEILPMKPTSITDLNYLMAFPGWLPAWQEELNKERHDYARYSQYVQDWVGRIRQKDERDDADLRRIYIDNANVIGITCVQAGNKQFSQEYRDFDCVIVDEVSKATPPELLLPILKGTKVVLVGDHKQLPPMVGSDSIADLAEQLDVPKEELDHLERSLFGELFNNCPADLKCMLKTQYRMHPQIMDAINQFYDYGLECGMKDPDKERAHCCDALIENTNHLVWLHTPVEPGFYETRIGTTFQNTCELEILVKFVEQLDAAWGLARVQDGKGELLPEKEVGVITFYASQANELKKRLLERKEEQMFKNLKIRTGTVDRFQGMEKAIVIVSLVRNNNAGDIGFARAPERINVAFSRAQELLVIIGSKELFCDRANKRSAIELYGKVADVVSEHEGWHDISEYR